jgi:hypothetical protein
MKWTSSWDNPFSADLMWTVWARIVPRDWEGDSRDERDSDELDSDELDSDTSMMSDP